MHIEYKKYTAQSKHILKKAQKKSWAEFCNALDFNIPRTKVWKFINKMRGKYNSNNFPLTKNGALLKTHKEKAELLAEHYKTKLSNGNEIGYLPEYEEKRREAGPREMEEPFTLEELETVVHNLKKGKSMGEDQIANEFLKNLPENKMEEWLKIINKLWEEGGFPEEAKNSIIIPLLKEGKDPSKTNSYRVNTHRVD